METYTIVYWPCGTWCHEDEVGEYTWKSDDYEHIEIPMDQDADEWLFKNDYQL